MILCRLKNCINLHHFKISTYLKKMHCNKTKNKAALAVPEMFTIWTQDFHMTGTVCKSVNVSGIPL